MPHLLKRLEGGVRRRGLRAAFVAVPLAVLVMTVLVTRLREGR